jgi:cobalt-zinc-cadmium efflux system protein
VLIAVETIGRIRHPVPVDSGIVIFVSLAGILVNGITVWLFRKGQREDLNIRSAFLHFIADTLVSMGVVVSGLIIYLTGKFWIDSAVSIIILIVILYSTYKLMLDSVNLALDAVPENINIRDVRSYLESLPEVSDLHDLHIWALSTTSAALTVHLSTKIPTDVKFINAIQQKLHERFKIEHTTIQVEFGEKDSSCNNCN